MGFFPGSVIDLTNATPITVAVVDATGNQITTFSSVATPPANATLTQVAQSATSVTILAANANRKQAFIWNTGSKNLSIAFAATATLTAFTLVLPSNTGVDLPLLGYTGVISGIWTAAGSGFAVVTEVTP